MTKKEAILMLKEQRQMEIDAAKSVEELKDVDLRAAAYHLVLAHMQKDYVQPSERFGGSAYPKPRQPKKRKERANEQ